MLIEILWTNRLVLEVGWNCFFFRMNIWSHLRWLYTHCHLEVHLFAPFCSDDPLQALTCPRPLTGHKKRRHKFRKNLTTVSVLKIVLSGNVTSLKSDPAAPSRRIEAGSRPFAAFSEVESHFGSPIRALECQAHTTNSHKSRHKVKLLTDRPSILLSKWVFRQSGNLILCSKCHDHNHTSEITESGFWTIWQI